ncbi:hypothetical protein CYJ37_25580 [Bacillus sp. UMB0728]|nr:hypothetical protein CYJ37_25580 [Bacillus sp. UMB0728]
MLTALLCRIKTRFIHPSGLFFFQPMKVLGDGATVFGLERRWQSIDGACGWDPAIFVAIGKLSEEFGRLIGRLIE